MRKQGFHSRPNETSQNYYTNHRFNERNLNRFASYNYNRYLFPNFPPNINMNYMRDQRERHFTRAVPVTGQSNIQNSQKEMIRISIENKKNNSIINENALKSDQTSIQIPNSIKIFSSKPNQYKSEPSKRSSTQDLDTEFSIGHSKKNVTNENDQSENGQNLFSPKKRKIDTPEPISKTNTINAKSILNDKDSSQGGGDNLPTNSDSLHSTSLLSTEPSANPHLKSLEHYDKDLAQVKIRIASQLKVVRELRDKFNLEYNSLKELKIIKKTIVEKVKKICRALTKEDRDQSDTSDNVEQIGEPNEIIDLETSSESEGSDSEPDSSDVEFISETPKKTETETQKSKLPTNSNVISSSQKSANSADTSLSKSNSSQKTPFNSITLGARLKTSPRKAVKRSFGDRLAPMMKFESNESNIKHVNGANPAPRDLSNSNAQKSPHVNDVKIPRESVPESCRSLPALNVPPEIDIRLRADAENGLFNAIEPALDTIVVSDKSDCCITDVKVFNNRLFVSASHGLLRQYNLTNHKCVMEYLGHKELVHCILPTAHPAGIKRLISGGFDQQLIIHDIDTGVVLKRIPCDRPIMTICDLYDYVYFGTGGGAIVTYSLDKDKEMNTFQASTSGISCLSATKEANQNLLFVGFNDGEYCVFDAISFIKIKVITPMAYVEHPIGFVILPKQRVLAFTKHHVHFIYYAKSKSTTTFNHLPDISSMCLTKHYAIVGEKSGNISVYRIKGSLIPKNPVQKITNEKYSIPSLTFYNNTIITGNMNGKICFNRLVES